MSQDEDSHIISPAEAEVESLANKELSLMDRRELEHAFKKLLHINHVAIARVQALEDDLDNHKTKLEALKHKKKGKKRYHREQIFELVDSFNPKTVTRLPLKHRVFLMGHVDDMLVVEVPNHHTEDAIDEFKQYMTKIGMTSPSMIVTAGVRFLKLKPCDSEQEKAINKQLKMLDDERRKAEATASDAATEDGRAEERRPSADAPETA